MAMAFLLQDTLDWYHFRIHQVPLHQIPEVVCQLNKVYQA
jgi:hypothetical protein